MEADLLLVDFRLRMRMFEEGRQSVPGFVGSASIRLQGRHPESVIKGLNVLADYAFFCGTGIGTQRGMGLTRRILEKGART
jgi:CRISPR/Cas system endoribonuclease Cas6 (RAMP superfamily)